MEIVYLIIALVWSVLVIILFFKVWGMTNNVKEILEVLKSVQNPNNSTKDSVSESKIAPDENCTQISIGSIVYRCSDGCKMLVERSAADQYYCVEPDTHKYIDTYNRKEISVKGLN